MQESSIAWTEETWNPVHGCSHVSAGCDHCYAEARSYGRYGHTDKPWTPENAAENVTQKPHKLDEPRSITEGKRIFVNSMSDLFHSRVSDEFIEEVFTVMRETSRHTYQILTKRPGRAAHMDLDWPENVWMGTSVEDERVTERLDLLRECEAETLFISFEPLIGEIEDPTLTGYDLAIVGGESGAERRPMAHEWVWPIKAACRDVGAAFFFKQSSAYRPGSETALRCRDGLRREFHELPDPAPVTVAARREREEMDEAAP